MSHGIAQYMEQYLQSTGGTFTPHRYPNLQHHNFTQSWLLQPAKPNRQLIIFCHGTGNDAFYPFISLFIQLLRQGNNILTFDLDGHGYFSTTHLRPQEFHTCLDRLLDQLSFDITPYQVHMVGHSLGGIPALHSASQPRKRPCTSLTLVTTPLDLTHLKSVPWYELMSLLSPSLWRQLQFYTPYELLPAIGNFKRHTYPVRTECINHALGYVNQVAQILNTQRTLALCKTVKAPVLLCYGKWDCIAPYIHGKQVHQQLTHSQLHLSATGTHFTTLLSPRVEASIQKWIQTWSHT
ncbi:MAG: alpha/beta fold hydrolase [Zetaproteobacteria bacterium]|nr:alpha/beta fold hydrolase [Zetaproteobacteria bacterium]